MIPARISVAMEEAICEQLQDHLCRVDGQEDLCLATYRRSTGHERLTALVRAVILPNPGERSVHGNASVTGNYVVRAALFAADRNEGVIILHSHPEGSGWQGMSRLDQDAERSYAYLVHAITGLPLIGMTLAGTDRSWSARTWTQAGVFSDCENVRVLGSKLQVSWNDSLRPPPRVGPTQTRSASAWGEIQQADIARLRVLVVGAGSVGLEVSRRLAASGIQQIGIMDFDTVEFLNLDRLIGATPFDAWLNRSKVEVAMRETSASTTAERPDIRTYDLSVCERQGLANALDYDLIFSCVDRPWARALLNEVAYSDLIPVIDGGIQIDPFPGGGMRNGTWRSHVIRPGRPCLICNKQLDPALVPLDREGLLDNPQYIAESEIEPSRQNVATLSVSVVSGMLGQFVSLVAAPGGIGEPGPLRYALSTHTLEHLEWDSNPNCYVESRIAEGDLRTDISGPHRQAQIERTSRQSSRRRLGVRLAMIMDEAVSGIRASISRAALRSINEVGRRAS